MAIPFLNIEVVNFSFFVLFVVDRFLEGYILALEELNGSGFSLFQFCLHFDLLFDYAVGFAFFSFCNAVIIAQPGLKAMIECGRVWDAAHGSVDVLFYFSIIT